MGYGVGTYKEYKFNQFRPQELTLNDLVQKKIREKREMQQTLPMPIHYVNINEPYPAPSAVMRLEAVFGQYVSKITQLYKGGEWAGKRCFLLGGGASMCGLDLTPLADELTIGTNRIFEIFSPTILYSMDIRFYQWIVELELDRFSKDEVYRKYLDFKGIRVFLCPLSYHDFGDYSVYIVRRKFEKCISFDLESGIYGGNNSGFGALMLAIALRANPIYLLGYDMCIKDDKSHWHNGYPKQQNVILAQHLKSYADLLTEFSPLIKELGIRIVNLNPESAVRCFEFDTLDNVLNT